MKPYGKLYLLPSPLGDNDPAEVIPAPVLELLKGIDTYVVEELRTVRRYLSRAGLKGHVDALHLTELNEHTTKAEVEAMAALFEEGQSVGLITEAGLPAVADPGSALVALCHRQGIRVVPFVGPSSLMMALMGSGLNGQSFAFLGYLPAKTDERRAAIKTIEKQSAAQHQTQIFIETPYRNDAMMEDLLRICAPGTRLCIAADITLPEETILTRAIAQWRKNPLTLGKRPCVFLILAQK